MIDADQRLLAVRQGGRRLGVPAALVGQVAVMPRLSRVPLAPAAMLGLANMRGTVVPVLSLAALLGEEQTATRRVILVDAGEAVGLAVDGVEEIVDAGDTIERIDIAALVAGIVTAGAGARRASAALAIDEGETAQDERLALVSFAVGHQDFALPLTAVEEVLRVPQEIARVPHADAAVVGSVVSRGTVLPLLSLPALLGLPALDEGNRARVLVVRIGAHRVGLVVDAMRAVLRVDEADIDAVPQVLNRGGAEAGIDAICRIDGGRHLVSVLATDRLVRGDITARLLQGGAGGQDAVEQDRAEKPTEQFLVLRIGAESFGLPIDAVEEVTALPAKLTPLPRAPGFVEGVMNLRGQVIPVIDQAQRFGGAASAGARRRVVVVRMGDLHAGFIVDAVSEVLRVETDSLSPAPDLGKGETRMFERVANLMDEGRMILIVSPRELLDRAEQALLRALEVGGAAAAS
ncbi:MAG: chemotaxis protein CheW [Sphingobium sp.]